MFRKVLAATLVGFVLTSALVSATAGAATTTISNGVLCPKLGAKKNANGNTYYCSLNTVVNSKKNTWTTVDCVTVNKQYAKSNKDYLAISASMTTTLATIDQQIADETAKGVEASAKADALDLQIKDWQAKIAEYTAARTDAQAKRDALMQDKTHGDLSKAIATYQGAITNLTTAMSSLNSAVRGAISSSKALRKVGKSADTMKTVRASTVANLAQAKAGVDQALALRKLICQKGL